MPAVGNGHCGYSAYHCADAIVDAMVDVSLIKNCSLSKIVICLNDQETYKTFIKKLEFASERK